MGSSENIWTALAVIIGFGGSLLAYFFLKLREHRAMLKGLPQPPNAGWLGHMKIMNGLMEEYPREVHPHVYPHLIREKYGLGDIFYLDLWPLAYPMLVISDPQIAQQALHLPKHEVLGQVVGPVVGDHSILTMEGKEWRTWRSVFNPGFSHSNIMTLVPGIVEDSLVFCDVLEEHARKGDVFRLEDAATRVTVDIIGRVVLDARFNAQRSRNPLLSAMQNQIKWSDSRESLNPLIRFSPLRPLMFYLNNRRMESYIGRILQDRLSVRRADAPVTKGKKHVIDLALERYFAEEKQDVSLGQRVIDPTFQCYATDQMRTFLFAGHDTTSSTIAFCYYMLRNNPKHLDRVMKEHTEVFGSDLESAPRLLREQPQLISKLDYTSAVIKEVLRLYPPASSLRKGSKDFFMLDPKTGQTLPTNGFMVWINHVSIHRNADLWDSPNEFRPERFTSSASEEGRHRDSWRPFEKGARACIGQEFALIETKIILVLTLRKFDIRAAYDELDKLSSDGSGWPVPQSGEQQLFGEEAFQILRGTAKPRQGMPARVTWRSTV